MTNFGSETLRNILELVSYFFNILKCLLNLKKKKAFLCFRISPVKLYSTNTEFTFLIVDIIKLVKKYYCGQDSIYWLSN